MSDVTLSYKGSDILELSDSGSATLKTGGTYCEADIELEYVKPSGGDTEWNVIKSIYTAVIIDMQSVPKKYKILSDVLNSVQIGVNGQHATAIEEIAIEATPVANGLTFTTNFNENAPYALQKINLNFIPLMSCYQAFGFTYDRGQSFESVYGLNFSKCGGSNYRVGSNFSNAKALKNVTITPNSLGKLDMVATNRNWLEFRTSSLLTDESLVQIANCLCADYVSLLRLHATPLARLSEIVGTVSTQTDDDGNYDFFTADANGTVSLMDFITNTKGWSVST